MSEITRIKNGNIPGQLSEKLEAIGCGVGRGVAVLDVLDNTLNKNIAAIYAIKDELANINREMKIITLLLFLLFSIAVVFVYFKT